MTTWTQVCPNGATDGGPYVTDNWVDQSPGEIVPDRYRQQDDRTDRWRPGCRRHVQPGTFRHGLCHRVGNPETGIANYETAAAPAGGFTVMGSPTVIARYSYSSDEPPQVAARHWSTSRPTAPPRHWSTAEFCLPDTGFQVFQLNHGMAGMLTRATSSVSSCCPSTAATPIRSPDCCPTSGVRPTTSRRSPSRISNSGSRSRNSPGR